MSSHNLNILKIQNQILVSENTNEIIERVKNISNTHLLGLADGKQFEDYN